MKAWWLFCLPLLHASTAFAQVTLPSFLSDRMVVQRERPIHIWGLAAPEEQISVTFRGETRTTTVGQLGRWSVYLSPSPAGGPFEMIIRGITTGENINREPPQLITLHDILVGDVWIASGQSNMQFALQDASTGPRDLPKASNPHIRLLLVEMRAADYPQDDLPNKGWATSSPESAKDFSAVAWYFAREIEQREHVPVGIIASSWGARRLRLGSD